MFPTHIPRIEALVNLPFVNLRQAKLFQTRHCCEKLRFASCTSTKWEQACVIQMRTVNLLTLILYPANYLQMGHLGINQVCNLELGFHMTELRVVLGLVNVTWQLLVTSFVPFCHGVSTDHDKSGRLILAKYKHFRQSEHIPQRALRLFQNLPEVFGDRLCMVLPPAEEMTHLSLPVRSISQRIFRHDLPHHSSKL